MSLACVKAEAATLFAAFDEFGLLRILDALLATPLEVCSFLATPCPSVIGWSTLTPYLFRVESVFLEC